MQRTVSSRISTVLAIAALIIASLCLRVLLPYHNVFTGDGVMFLSIDAYYHMRIADNLLYNFPHLMAYDPYFIYPGGSGGTGAVHLFDYLLAAVTRVLSGGQYSPGILDTVGAALPAVLGALVIIPVYFLGKALHNRMTGMVAALLIAIIPGEYLGRSLLGFTDYHVMEVLLSTTTILFLIKSIRSREQYEGWKVTAVWAILAAVSLTLYFLTWRGAMLFSGITLLMLLLALRPGKPIHRWIILSASGAIMVLLALYSSAPELLTGRFNLPLNGDTIVELQRMTPVAIWNNYGYCVLAALIAFILIAVRSVKEDNRVMACLVAWSIIISALAMGHVRFMYYGAVNVSLLCALLTAMLHDKLIHIDLHHFKAIRITAVVSLLLIMAVPCTIMSIEQGQKAPYSPPEAWRDALMWLRNNTPEPLGGADAYYRVCPDTRGFAYPETAYGIASWWDYGYWITRIGHRLPVTNPSQGSSAQKVSQLLTAIDTCSIRAIVDELDTGYIIIDGAMVRGKLPAIVRWAEPEDVTLDIADMLMVRLYRDDGMALDDGMSLGLAYSSGDVKVFQLTRADEKGDSR